MWNCYPTIISSTNKNSESTKAHSVHLQLIRTGGQGRSQLPGLHEQGEVPGDDLGTHAHRLVTGVAGEEARSGQVRSAHNQTGS